MRNFKISIDLSSIYLELSHLNMREYTKPFMLVFIEAANPDDACITVIRRIISQIMNNGDSLENRIICQRVKRLIRIERIQSL